MLNTNEKEMYAKKAFLQAMSEWLIVGKIVMKSAQIDLIKDGDDFRAIAMNDKYYCEGRIRNPYKIGKAEDKSFRATLTLVKDLKHEQTSHPMHTVLVEI